MEEAVAVLRHIAHFHVSQADELPDALPPQLMRHMAVI